MKRKGFAPILLIVVAAILVIAGGVWYYETHKMVNSHTPSAFGISPSDAPPELAYRDDQGDVFLVIDAQGRRAGVNPYSGVIYQEIPGSYYVENKDQEFLTIPNPATGAYTIAIFGGSPGEYSFASYTNDGNSLFSQVASGTIASEGTVVYTQQYDPDNLSIGALTLQSTPSSATIAMYAQSTPDNPWLASIKQTSPEIVNIPSSSSTPSELQGKVAYMQNGEVWIANKDGSGALQLTNTSGSVSTNAGDGGLFAFSPDFHYLAYYILWPSGSRAYASGTIAIFDFDKNKVVQEINGSTIEHNSLVALPASQTPYVSFEAWKSNDQFVYGAWGLDGPGGGADEYAHLLMDLGKETTTVIQPQ